VTVHLTWDSEVDAGHLYLTPVGPGQTVHQRMIENPVAWLGDVILDFDSRGRLLGIEFLDHQLLPPGLYPAG